MKLAVSGKGGVGKTTISALLVAELTGRGYRVTAVDADPNPNLARALGFPSSPATPLVDLREEVEARVGSSGSLIRLNPRVDDLVERCAATQGGVQLIVAGAISRGGGGCACPQSILLRRVLEHLVLERDQAVVIDLEAGLEHLGRRSAQAADALLVVVDPSRGSLETAQRIRRLASEIGLERVMAVGNRVRDRADEAYLADGLRDIPLIAAMPYRPALQEAERDGRPVAVADPEVRGAMRRLVDELEARLKRRVSA